MAKGWIFSFGLFLPAFWTLSSNPSADPGGTPFWDREVFPKTWYPAVLLAALGLAAGRVWEWSSGQAWPTADESITGTLAFLLFGKDGWGLIHSLGQMPPLWPWVVALLLRLNGSPFAALWLPCTLTYLSMVAMAYLACRRSFGRSLSLLVAGLTALGYWPLLLQRLSYQETTLPLWVFSCFWAWGGFRDPSAGSGRSRAAWVLGLVVGLGPFTFLSWVPVGLGFFLALAAQSRRNGVRKAIPFFLMGFSLTMGLSLLLAGEHFMGRVWTILGFRSGWETQALVMANYFSILFGGAFGGLDAYMLWGGGFLNPLLGAFFLIGLFEWMRRNPWKRGLGTIAAASFLMAPGLFSNTVDPFRIVQVLPFLVLGTALGVQWAFTRLPTGNLRKGLLAVLLLVSGSFDLVRLEGPGWDIREHPERLAQVGSTCEKYQAFRVLEDLSRQAGPGLVFSEFTPQTRDQSLAFASYPFNAALNPALPAGGARWAALLCPLHYAPLLEKTFPASRWFFLDSQVKGLPGSDLLSVIALEPKAAPLLLSWARSYPAYQKVNMEELDLTNGLSRRSILEGLLSLYPALPKDPFLQSSYFEKLLFEASWEETFHPGEPPPTDLVERLESSFQAGCQDWVLCEKYGKWCASHGREAQARRLLEKTLVLEPGTETARDELRQLDADAGR